MDRVSNQSFISACDIITPEIALVFFFIDDTRVVKIALRMVATTPEPLTDDPLIIRARITRGLLGDVVAILDDCVVHNISVGSPCVDHVGRGRIAGFYLATEQLQGAHSTNPAGQNDGNDELYQAHQNPILPIFPIHFVLLAPMALASKYEAVWGFLLF
jgi:hypothetical protein